ncbi:hypothetical protein [Amycolatopsis mediterranei]|uniref:hypothetical protein n=1 Tax=Amycolatopsis mediterranei TaxID=33910 RepID=UPI00030988D7|nr:hypothetical protein [Amycolatopsis mediterranei]UZF73049.1 hypothetical protein ISP_006453 [Amycolatopsis mediterranei]
MTALIRPSSLAGAVAGSRLIAQGCSPDPRIDRTTPAPATTPSAGTAIGRGGGQGGR